ncbi:amino acid ABC transporter permease [Streptomyces sp. NPDC020801]|uniref:amino acid ABC transporter permease n=1 Tax=unclassified Streptomyces TaxID=2593676 RepID=UPI0037BDB5C9
MAWEEWEQLKTAAAERHGTRMQLNQVPADIGGSGSGAGGGSGTGRLRHTHGPWTRAATVADDLHTSTVKSKADLRLAHDDMALGGLASLATIKAVLASWEKRLGAVRDECSTLGPKLRQVAVDMGEVDQAVSTKVGAVHVSGSGRD